jgi:hypothetical protein
MRRQDCCCCCCSSSRQQCPELALHHAVLAVLHHSTQQQRQRQTSAVDTAEATGEVTPQPHRPGRAAWCGTHGVGAALCGTHGVGAALCGTHALAVHTRAAPEQPRLAGLTAAANIAGRRQHHHPMTDRASNHMAHLHMHVRRNARTCATQVALSGDRLCCPAARDAHARRTGSVSHVCRPTVLLHAHMYAIKLMTENPQQSAAGSSAATTTQQAKAQTSTRRSVCVQVKSRAVRM